MAVDIQAPDALAGEGTDDRGTDASLAPCGSHTGKSRHELRARPGPKPAAGRSLTAAERSAAYRERRKAQPPSEAPIPPRTAVPAWYCVQTEHGEDTSASIEIAAAGFRILSLSLFRPAVDARRDTSGVRHRAIPARIVPLFPGYLIVQFDSSDPEWRRINGLPGVDRVLASAASRPGSAPTPCRIPDSAIERVLKLPGLDANGCLYPPGYSQEGAPIQAGTPIHVVDTPLPQSDRICDWSDSKRVRFLGELFGRDNVPITVSRRHVNQV